MWFAYAMLLQLEIIQRWPQWGLNLYSRMWQNESTSWTFWCSNRNIQIIFKLCQYHRCWWPGPLHGQVTRSSLARVLSWRRFDVIMTLFLRYVSVGKCSSCCFDLSVWHWCCPPNTQAPSKVFGVYTSTTLLISKHSVTNLHKQH